MPRLAKIPAVRFNLKSHDKKEDLKPILVILVFRYKGGRLVYSTGEKVKPRYWLNGRAKPNIKKHSHYLPLNQRLDSLAKHTTDIYIENNFGNISIEDFKIELSYRNGDKERPSGNKPTLYEFIETYLAGRTANIKNLVTSFNLLKEYGKLQKKQFNYEDIDWQFRNDFVKHLYEVKNYSVSSTNKTIKNIKHFLDAAYKLNYHENRIPSQTGYNVKLVKTKNKVRLTFDEIKQLIDLDLSDNKRLERVRDLMIVGCYTGLRFSDWYKVKKENIIKTDVGNKETLSILTEKTKTNVFIPFLPELKTVMEKYDYILPKITPQKFNKYIKEVCQMVLVDKKFKRIFSSGGVVQDEVIEKWKKVSSHSARKSFATNFWEIGIEPSILMQITGHSTQKQFFEYIDVNPQELAQRFANKVAMITENNKQQKTK